MNSNRIARLAAAGMLTAGIALTTAAVPASASHGGGDGVSNSGRCSQGSTWKLKAKADDGRLEVEAEVDTNVKGQAFTWRLTDNGSVAAKGKSTTHGPSGSFSVERRIPNQSGSDKLMFKARNAANGEVCTGSVTF